MSKVYVSSVHTKIYSAKIPRQFTYKENKSKVTHSSTLVYITIPLVGYSPGYSNLCSPIGLLLADGVSTLLCVIFSF